MTWRDCLDKFASGALDGHLLAARKPYLAQFWPWVVEAVRERRGAEIASELQAAEEREAKLKQETEALEHEMEERDQDTVPELESRHGEIAAKKKNLIFEAASDTFRSSLRVYFSQLQQFDHENMHEAVKIWQAKAAQRRALEATWFYKKKEGNKTGGFRTGHARFCLPSFRYAT